MLIKLHTNTMIDALSLPKLIQPIKKEKEFSMKTQNAFTEIPKLLQEPSF